MNTSHPLQNPQSPLLTEIEQRLRIALTITHLSLVDDSDHHRGHPNAPGHAASHVRLSLVSPDFQHKTALERHRLIYTALGDLVGGSIHALRIEAKTPEEAQGS